MYIYHVKYFSSIDWRWLESNVIAENDAQVTDLVESNLCKREYRSRPYNGGQDEDSLTIESKREIKFPSVIDWKI
jgi:hypothetical protein